MVLVKVNVEFTMGVRHLREAFNNAGAGQVTCTEALMDTAHDEEGEHSILTFAGATSGGESFRISSRPCLDLGRTRMRWRPRRRTP